MLVSLHSLVSLDTMSSVHSLTKLQAWLVSKNKKLLYRKVTIIAQNCLILVELCGLWENCEIGRQADTAKAAGDDLKNTPDMVYFLKRRVSGD